MTYRKQPVPEHPETTEEKWVRTWGEAVNIETAAKILGVSRDTVSRRIKEGHLFTTPMGSVLVREMCRWAHSNVSYARKQRLVAIP